MDIIGYLTNWLKDIVILLIIISIIEILLPKGNMKKYINFVIGLLIILIIANPLVEFLNLDYKMERLRVNDHKINKNYDDSIETMNTMQEMQIKNIYIDKIKHEMKNTIENSLNYLLKDIKITLVEETQDKWSIDEVLIFIKEEESVNNNKMNIEKIEKIDIENNIQDIVHDFTDLINLIHNNFEIDKNKIIVKLIK